MISDPRDDVAFARIVNVPARGIGKETLTRLRDFAAALPLLCKEGVGEVDHDLPHLTSPYKGEGIEGAVGLFDSVVDFVKSERLKPSTAKKLLAFHKMIEELRTDIEDKPLSQILRSVLEKTGYVEALASQKTTEAQDRIENINELVAAVEEFAAKFETLQGEGGVRGESQLTQFLDQVALVSDTDSYDENTDAVTLMTLHLAKGLEFPVVFMVGMEEGLLPHIRSLDDPDELEEERRLCYVGMTRAKELLTVSHAFRRQTFGTPRYGVASRFIDEIPEEYLSRTVIDGIGIRRANVSAISRTAVSAVHSDRRDACPTTSHKSPARHAMPQGEAGGQVTSHDSDFDQRPPEERIGLFAAGTRVHHPTFGKGLVKRCEPSSAGHKVTVQFQSGFVKRLIAERAGLIPL